MESGFSAFDDVGFGLQRDEREWGMMRLSYSAAMLMRAYVASGNKLSLRWLMLIGALALCFGFSPWAVAACSEEISLKPTWYHIEIKGRCPDKASAIAACVAVANSHGYEYGQCNESANPELGTYRWGGWFNYQKDVQTTPFTFAMYSYQGGEQVLPYKNLGAPGCGDQCFGDPINAGTGNKFEFHREYRSDGAFPLEVSWTYNWKTDSSYVYKAANIFGRKRSHFYGRYLVAFDSQIRRLVYVYRPDGKALKFSAGAQGWENSEGSETLSEVFTEGGQSGWVLVDPKGLTEHYDLKGRLITLTSRNGRRQVLAYRTSGEPSTITDDQGRQLKFEYNSSGQAAKIILPDGGSVTLAYSSAMDLAEVKHAGGATTRYLYDEAGYVVSSTAGALTGVVDEQGVRQSSTRYDSQGRAYATELAGGADAASSTYVSSPAGMYNQSAKVVSPGGAVRDVTFSLLNGVVRPTQTITSCVGCASRQVTYTYDINGWQDVVTVQGVATDYDYDANGLLQQQVEAANDSATRRTLQTDWHPTLRLPTERRVLNAGNVLVDKQAWTYNSRGQVLTHTVSEP